MKPCNSCELRSSTMWRCDCIKRNGLQDRCQLIDCLGRPECMTKLFPICGPGKKALLQLTDLGDTEVALKKFYSADKAREAALAAYCRLKCSGTEKFSTSNSPCPLLNSSSPNCPLTNSSPPNCPLSNSSSPNCPLSNSPPPYCSLSNSPPSNSPSSNYNSSSRNCPSNSPSPNCPSNSPSPNCPFNSQSRNCPSGNYPPDSYPTNFPSASYTSNRNNNNNNYYPPPTYQSNINQSYPSNSNNQVSYLQSFNNCPPPYRSLSPSFNVSSSSPVFCPKPRIQSCPQQQFQNQNFLSNPQSCATCISH
ncbi:uncharacterized protein LOC127285234 isoform X2 [Leptopilina boulardi]|nr:uncharacterized protein LOC127285234 isoform X2 [Leptopilina boulardi]